MKKVIGLFKNNLLLYFIINILVAKYGFAAPISNNIIDWANLYGQRSCEEFREELRTSDNETFHRHLGDFVEPNETNPCIALGLFEEVPQNRPVIAVGTERGFIAAAATKASHLFLLDISQSVIVFNTINTILLKASENREDYKYLRLEATAQDWTTHFDQVGVEFETENRDDAIRLLWNFWHNRVRHGHLNGSFEGFHNKFSKVSRSINDAYVDIDIEKFINVNYLLNNEEFYTHLKWMADNNRIFSFIQNIRTIKKDSEVFQHLNQIKSKIGLIDVSNTIYIEDYCYNVYRTHGNPWFEHDTALMVILSFEPYLDNATIFMNTAFRSTLETCREYLLTNLGVIKEIDLDNLDCFIEDPSPQADNFDSYYTIHAKGLLPANIKDLSTLAQFIANYENRQCKIDENKDYNSDLDYSTDPFQFKNWGPSCMIEADKWPISRSHPVRDDHYCKPKKT